MSEEQVTVVWLLVPWAQDILTAIETGELRLDDYRLNQWRLMHIGAQPVPPSLVKEWQRVFPHHEYDTNYGLTEATGPGCVHLGVGNLHKVGAIGLPGFGWETSIVDEELKTGFQRRRRRVDPSWRRRNAMLLQKSGSHIRHHQRRVASDRGCGQRR